MSRQSEKIVKGAREHLESGEEVLVALGYTIALTVRA
jgi:hypothetical protein